MKRLLILLVLTAWPVAAFAQNTFEPPLITVTGQAEVRVAPDEVLFTLVIENVDKDLVAAARKTDDSVRQILAIARKHSIKSEDVQTSQISVQPKYNTDDMEYEARRNIKRVMIGYQVSKTMAIRLRDISRFDALLADILQAGITRLSNLQFLDSQLRKHRDQARVMAIRAAKEKAELLVREIGQSIGTAYSITEDSNLPVNGRTTQNASLDSFVSGDPSESAIAPGTLSISAQVTVRFRLQ